MGIKGEASKIKILKASEKLFAEKGFSAVSMQDICKETRLSRGGLYRYFGSTEEIFIEIIEEEQAVALQRFEWAMQRKVSPELMLFTFVRSRAMRLIDDCSFDNAVSEFAANSERGRDVLKKRALTSVRIMTRMVEAGCESGDFTCEDSSSAATHILWVLEGMCKHHALNKLTHKDVERQLELISKLLK